MSLGSTAAGDRQDQNKRKNDLDDARKKDDYKWGHSRYEHYARLLPANDVKQAPILGYGD